MEGGMGVEAKEWIKPQPKRLTIVYRLKTNMMPKRRTLERFTFIIHQSRFNHQTEHHK